MVYVTIFYLDKQFSKNENERIEKMMREQKVSAAIYDCTYYVFLHDKQQSPRFISTICNALRANITSDENFVNVEREKRLKNHKELPQQQQGHFPESKKTFMEFSAELDEIEKIVDQRKRNELYQQLLQKIDKEDQKQCMTDFELSYFALLAALKLKNQIMSDQTFMSMSKEIYELTFYKADDKYVLLNFQEFDFNIPLCRSFSDFDSFLKRIRAEK